MRIPSPSSLAAHFDGARGLVLCGMRAYEEAVSELRSALQDTAEPAYVWALVESLLALQRYDDAQAAVAAHLPDLEPVLAPAIDLLAGRPTDRLGRALAIASKGAERQRILGFWAGVLAAGLGDERAARTHLERYRQHTPGCDVGAWVYREVCRRLGEPIYDGEAVDEASENEEDARDAVGSVGADDLERDFDVACRTALSAAEARALHERRTCALTDDVVRSLIDVDGVLDEFQWTRADVLQALEATKGDEEAAPRFSTAVWRGASNARWLWRFLESETDSVSAADLLAGLVLTEGRAYRALARRLIESTLVLNDLVVHGYSVSTAQWRTLEHVLVTSLDEVVPRALALGAAVRPGRHRCHARHVLWMAQRYPRVPNLWAGFCTMPWSDEVPGGYLDVLGEWRRLIIAAPDDRALLAVAAAQ